MSDFDVIVVGAGCAGAMAARELALLGRSVLLVERGQYPGAKNVTGGRLYTHVLAQAIPDFKERAPLERRITRERISLATNASLTTLDFASERLDPPGAESYSVLRAEFDRWLAGCAEDAGAELIAGIPVDGLIMDGGAVRGVTAGGDEIGADVTILADGIGSLLRAQAGLGGPPTPSQVAVGVRETYRLEPGVIEDRFDAEPGEGTAWLFAGAPTHGRPGGGFLYTNTASVSVGIVATLQDLVRGPGAVAVPQLVDAFTHHPRIAPLLRGGELVEYSAHLIPEGGYAALPRLYGDGVLVAGDAAMLCVNLGYQVRGMDFAMASGLAAARAAAAVSGAGVHGPDALAGYEADLRDSFVLRDLRRLRRVPRFLEGTPRIFGVYPELAEELLTSLFVVDGRPVAPLRRTVRRAMRAMGAEGAARAVGPARLARDVWKGMRAL